MGAKYTGAPAGMAFGSLVGCLLAEPFHALIALGKRAAAWNMSCTNFRHRPAQPRVALFALAMACEALTTPPFA